jgi:DNA-binding MarR family transcriptional regulator
VLRNRMAAGPSGSPFNAAESHVLINLIIHNGLTIGDLGPRIQHDQAATSRLVGKLTDSGYIEKRINPNDSRSVVVVAAQKTKEIFQGLEPDYNARSQKIYSKLTPQEQASLYNGFDKIGDYRGIPSSPLRPDEHPSRPPIRRYTVAIGFLGRGLLDTSISSTVWMILETLKRLPEAECTPAQISSLLGITRSTMTYSLKLLDKQGAIKKKVDEQDSRSYHLSLTPEGEELRNEVKEAAKNYLEGSFGRHSEDEQDFFLATYLKVIGGAAEAQAQKQAEQQAVTPSKSEGGEVLLSVEVAKATTAEALQEARAFALKILVSCNLAHRAPAVIAGASSEVFVARLGNQILGMVQVSSEAEPTIELVLVEPVVAEVLGKALMGKVSTAHPGIDGLMVQVSNVDAANS